jgi:hypothetical protein
VTTMLDLCFSKQAINACAVGHGFSQWHAEARHYYTMDGRVWFFCKTKT